MAADLKQFSNQPIPFSVEFQGKTLDFYAKPTNVETFFSSMKGVQSGVPAMRKTFRELLLDEDQLPVSKDWVEELLSGDGLFPLALKISDQINATLGLHDLAAKKG